MNRAEFQKLVGEQWDRIVEINNTKGHDYAGDDDALANFKADEERLRKILEAHGPHFLKWYIYFEKHYSAVMTFLEEGDVKSEPIDGRIDDVLLYLLLLSGLIHEEREKKSELETMGDIIAHQNERLGKLTPVEGGLIPPQKPDWNSPLT